MAMKWFSAPPNRSSSVTKGFRLLGEELELRCVPATSYRWSPLDGNDWSKTWVEIQGTVLVTRSNWEKYNETLRDWFRTEDIPGADADIFFVGGAGNRKCVVDQAVEVHSMTLEEVYGRPIMLKDSLTILGSGEASILSMKGAGNAILGFNDGSGAITRGTLIMKENSLFYWKSGGLADITVKVESSPLAGGARGISVGEAGSGSIWMRSATIEVAGELKWNDQNVLVWDPVDGQPKSKIDIKSGGKFWIAAPNRSWGASATNLDVVNTGMVKLSTSGTASIFGNYTNSGTTQLISSGKLILVGDYTTTGLTELKNGTLVLSGTSTKQTSSGATFRLFTGTTVEVGVLDIRDGAIVGGGKVQGNLTIGDPSSMAYSGSAVISPGASEQHSGGLVIGTLTVQGHFQMFNGAMDIEIAGPTSFDKVEVSGSAKLSPAPLETFPGGKVLGNLMPVRDDIAATDTFPFLTYGSRAGDFIQVTPPNAGVNWAADKDATKYWFYPTQDFPGNKGKVGGRLFQDNGALAGIFESATESLLSGLTVNLRDASGASIVATTTSNASGEYEFPNLDAGPYIVEFVLPSGKRYALANQGSDDTLDSDPDSIGRVPVAVYDDLDHVDAGFFDNSPPNAINDDFQAHRNTAIANTVALNDTDSDGDALVYSVISGPAHGALTLNADGSFTYTPATDWTGTDQFTYSVADGFGGTNTANASIVVANTAPPVPTIDSYSVPADVFVDAEDGVLDNDTNPNNDTLTAILATGPAHGTLILNDDGSFLYTPDDDFVGNDSFTYRPSDDDGPGTLATVTISVTDTPPEADDDIASVVEDHAIEIAVLSNDDDADEDVLEVLGASDGIYGTTTVNENGTVTYTPPEDWYGTDWFVYVIDDGFGRLAYATVEVTVVQGGTIIGRIWDDTDLDGIQDSGETGRANVPVQLLDINNNLLATVNTDANGNYTFNNIAPGQHKIRVLAPTDYVFSLQDQGSDDAIDSDVNSSGYSALLTVTSGSLLDIDGALHPMEPDPEF